MTAKPLRRKNPGGAPRLCTKMGQTCSPIDGTICTKGRTTHLQACEAAFPCAVLT